MYQVFFYSLSLRDVSVSEVCNQKITVYRINLLKCKNWYVILLKVDSTRIQITELSVVQN